MLKKTITFTASVFLAFFTCFICASAECIHDFSPSEDSSNIIHNPDMSHSYRCRNNCGKYGTVSDGVNGKEKCDFHIVSCQEPDCVSGGKVIYACSVCYRNKEETIKPAAHSYQKKRYLPTCTRQGCDAYTCTGCGDSYCDNYTEASEHISDEGVVEVLPTFDKDGVIKISCRVCGTLIESRKLDRFVKEGKEPYSGKITDLKSAKYTASSVKLKWDKASGADSYKIAYSTDKRKWKHLTADKPCITVNNLKSAVVYYFKVTAVSNGITGEESGMISVCTKPSETVILKVKSSKAKSVTLKWKKLSNVSGYEISYTQDSFKKKKSVKTVTVTPKTNKTLKKLKSGKKYRFRIRGYKSFGTSKIFGAYSKVQSIRIR